MMLILFGFSYCLCVTSHALILRSSCESYSGEIRRETEFLNKHLCKENGPCLHVLMEKRGTHLVLKCHASGEPPPSVKWFKNNDQEVLSQTSNFILRNVKPKSSAKYVCQAVNKHGQLNWTFAISVTERRESSGDVALSNEIDHNFKPFHNWRQGPLVCKCDVEIDQSQSLSNPRNRHRKKSLRLHRKHRRRREAAGSKDTPSKLSLKRASNSATGILECERYLDSERSGLMLVLPDGIGKREDDSRVDPGVIPLPQSTNSLQGTKLKDFQKTHTSHAESPNRIYVRGVAFSVVVSFICVSIGFTGLLCYAIYRGRTTDEMISEKIDLT